MQKLPYPDPGVPDLRSPLRFLSWVARGQWRTLLAGVFFGVIWMVSQALFPAAVGQAIDLGIIADDMRALLIWAGVLVILGAVGALVVVIADQVSAVNAEPYMIGVRTALASVGNGVGGFGYLGSR